MTAIPAHPFDLVDAHCHVDLFPDPVALTRLVTERRIHTIAVTNAPSVFEHTERLASGSDYLHAAVGLHPELIPTHGQEAGRMWPFLERTQFVGEIGLDYSTNDDDLRARQRSVFLEILGKCAEYGDKTITIHSRRAVSDTIAAIGDHYPGRVILHWFAGSLRELDRAIQYGLYFSVNPAMVQSQRGRDLIKAMPRERILTESDGPFVRAGAQPADPASASIVVAFLSTLWRVPETEVAQTVLKNSGLIV